MKTDKEIKDILEDNGMEEIEQGVFENTQKEEKQQLFDLFGFRREDDE